MLNIEEVLEKEIWEHFLLESNLPYISFFQSWNWGEVQRKLDNPIIRLGVYNNKKLVGVCLVVEIKARRGHYLHLRHGPILLQFNSHFPFLLDHITKKARELRCDFIRISPLLEEQVFDMAYLRKKGFRNAPIHNMDAENAWVLDLDPSDEELLSSMRKTTRYLIRKAQKMSIHVRSTTKLSDFSSFMRLYTITSKRHGFVPHRGMKEELSIFSKDNQVKLFLAEYKRKIIAGALIIFYGNQAIYHHGATDDTYRDIPAAYLMQWEIIKEAKVLGKKIYNLWGVVKEERKNHPWQGLTLFKTGFGGRRINFIHAQDLPLAPLYWKTYLIEYGTKIFKGY